MADKQHGKPRFFLQFAHQIEDCFLHCYVKRSSRFVGYEQAGIAGHGHGYHHPLFLSAADLVWIGIENPRRVWKLNPLKKLKCSCFSFSEGSFLMQLNGLCHLMTTAKYWI